ncbi:MAG: glycosyltransferase family 4 protein [Candidatus Omnitrophica bacterium]|nr:glycosyltransferase family 4 protein [Candidatus Omnitrophota bacterium]
MKILIIHNHYLERGGEDEVVNAEARLLEEHGHKVILYEKSNEYLQKLPFLRKILFMLREMNFSGDVYKEIKEIVKREKPDIAHIHNIFFCITPSVYQALKEENVPIAQSLHNYRFFCLKGTFFRKGKPCEKCKNKQFFNAVARKCMRGSFILSCLFSRLTFRRNPFFRNIDSYIVTSEFSKNKLIEFGLEEKKIFLKNNFLAIEGQESREDNNYALYLGRFVDYKGVNTLMKVFETLPSSKLKIIGEGPLEKRLYSFASLHNNIELLGKVSKDSVFEAIKKSSFIIFPSECYENMPMVIIESFAFSKPVIASNLGAIKEFVIDGVNGLLFEPGNAKDLAEKVAYLFSHDKERIKMGKNANRTFRERFDKERNYNELISIYEKTINSGRGQ